MRHFEMRHHQTPAKARRQQIIEELRHNLRYAHGHERESLRTELDFWLRYR